MNILISGCSFLASKELDQILREKGHKVTNLSAPGAGNKYIADSIIKTYDSTIDCVFVMFSGLWRLELVLPADLQIKYQFSKQLGSSQYISSGGMLGIWQESNTPKLIKDYFSNQYKTQNLDYLAENSLLEVIKCLNFLSDNQINYTWTFIYDIFCDYTDSCCGHALGHISKDSNLLKLINWQRYTDITPYEFGVQHKLLSADEFHLTSTGYRQYFSKIGNQIINID